MKNEIKIRESVVQDNYIRLNIFGQLFIQRIGTGIPGGVTDKSWMECFGIAVEYLGKEIQKVARHGRYSKYKDFEGNRQINIGFTKDGEVINK